MKIFKKIKSILLLEFLFSECGDVCCEEEKTGRACSTCNDKKKKLILCYTCQAKSKGEKICLDCKCKNNLT